MTGELGRALALAARGDGILILSPEAAAHFYPATPEQVVNACYAAGFRVVTRGVIGDELVAAEYLRLWRDEPWGTLIRSTDPVVVETVRTQYPELVPYLAPVTTPAVAEARYLRARYGAGAAGSCTRASRRRANRRSSMPRSPSRTWSSSSAAGRGGADAADVLPADPRGAAAAPERRGRAAARDAGGGAAREPPVPDRPRARRAAGAGAGGGGGPDRPGVRGHPLVRGGARPSALGSAGRALLAARAGGERGAAAEPAAGGGPRGGGEHRGHVRRSSRGRLAADPAAVEAVLDAIGHGPERAAVGLRGLRLRHLRAVRRGGGARAGPRCGSARRTRSAGRTRRCARRRWTC